MSFLPSHIAEARFGAFVAPLLKSYLGSHGLDYQVRDSHGPKATLEMEYDGVVLVEVVRMVSDRICVTVRSSSPDTSLLRAAIKQTRLVLAPIFPDLAKYTKDDLPGAGLEGATPKQIDVINLLVLRMRRRGDSVRTCDGVVSIQYGMERYEIKLDGNYTKTS